MRIALAADHAGHDLKVVLRLWLLTQGHEITDLGPDAPDLADDYPDHARALAAEIVSGRVERGVLICGSGVGDAVERSGRARGVPRAGAVPQRIDSVGRLLATLPRRLTQKSTNSCDAYPRAAQRLKRGRNHKGHREYDGKEDRGFLVFLRALGVLCGEKRFPSYISEQPCSWHLASRPSHAHRV